MTHERPTPNPPLWLVMLATAMAGGMGWGIRGQYGHETGAMIAGVLVSLVLVFLFCPGNPSIHVIRAAALGTIAMGFRRLDDVRPNNRPDPRRAVDRQLGRTALGNARAGDQGWRVDRFPRAVPWTGPGRQTLPPVRDVSAGLGHAHCRLGGMVAVQLAARSRKQTAAVPIFFRPLEMGTRR